MQMVYIPPYEMLSHAGNYPVQLMLPQHLINSDYYSWYARHKDAHYIILDNGANENYKADNEELLSATHEFNVNEIVMPDVMGNFHMTLVKAEEFIRDYKKDVPQNVKLGFVLHGTSSNNVRDNFNALRKTYVYPYVSVVYLPRILASEKFPRTRIQAASWIRSYQEKEIHFLGASPFLLDELSILRDIAGSKAIRSMDTSAPYVYAMNGEYVASGKVLKRDDYSYWKSPMDLQTRKRALINCATMDEWAA